MAKSSFFNGTGVSTNYVSDLEGITEETKAHRDAAEVAASAALADAQQIAADINVASTNAASAQASATLAAHSVTDAADSAAQAANSQSAAATSALQVEASAAAALASEGVTDADAIAAAASAAAALVSENAAAASATEAEGHKNAITGLTTATGAAGSTVLYDSNSGVLTVPRGDTGATGPTGADSTVAGPTGPTGAASTVAGPTGPTGPTGQISAVGGWTVTEDSGSLYFSYNLSRKMRLDTSGNLDVVGSFNSAATLPALAGSTSIYAILTIEPKFVLDFKRGAYKTDGADTTFSSAMTHTASSNATMVDSDGLLKWRPHNLQVHSGDFSNSSWSKNAVTVDTSYVAPDGTSTASKLTSTGAAGATAIYDAINTAAGKSLTCFMKAGSSGVYGWIEGIVGSAPPYAVFDLESGTVVDSSECEASIEPVGNDWFRCVVANTTSSISFFSIGGSDNTYTDSSPWNYSTLTLGKFIYAWGAQLHRSDLGGMVNNPERSDSYIPTTTAAVYGPRTGHHIYDGTAWVNEGILHESEARTNLFGHSNGFDTSFISARSSVTAAAGTSPSGLSDAWRWTNTSTNALLYQSNSYVVGTYTVSAWVKSNGAGKDGFRLWGQDNKTSSDFTATSEWVRYSFTFTVTSAASGNGGLAYALGTNDVDVLVYGLQLEAGSTSSSYIPTTGVAATRSADLLTVPAANLPYSSTNMSIQIDGKMTYADNSLSFEVGPYRWLLSTSNYIRTGVNTVGGRSGLPVFNQRESTSGYDFVAGTNTQYSPAVNVPFNLAARHGPTFINGAHEGTLLTANTTPTALPNLSSTVLNLGYIFMGTIGQFRMWDEDITDAGIVEAST